MTKEKQLKEEAILEKKEWEKKFLQLQEDFRGAQDALVSRLVQITVLGLGEHQRFNSPKDSAGIILQESYVVEGISCFNMDLGWACFSYHIENNLPYDVKIIYLPFCSCFAHFLENKGIIFSQDNKGDVIKVTCILPVHVKVGEKETNKFL